MEYRVISARGERRRTSDLLDDFYLQSRFRSWPVLASHRVFNAFLARGEDMEEDRTLLWKPQVVTRPEHAAMVRRLTGRATVPAREFCSATLRYSTRRAPAWVIDVHAFEAWLSELMYGWPHREYLPILRGVASEVAAVRKTESHDEYLDQMARLEKWVKARLRFWARHPVEYSRAWSRPYSDLPGADERGASSFRVDMVIAHELLGAGTVRGFVHEDDRVRVVAKFESDPSRLYMLPPALLTPVANPPAKRG
jgi:hypothetical protein